MSAEDQVVVEERQVLFEPFKWHYGKVGHKDAANLDFAGKVRDIAGGVQTILAILERDEIDSGCGDVDGKPWPRLIDSGHSGSLMRLCITSLEMLGDLAAEHGDRIG